MNAPKYLENNFQKVSHYSLTKPPRCSEIHSHCSECSQQQKLTRPSLLVPASSNLAAVSAFNTRGLTTQAYLLQRSPTMSAHGSYQLSRNPNPFSTQTTYYKFCFAVDIKLNLPHSRNLLLSPVKCSTSLVRFTVLTNFLQQDSIINIHASTMINTQISLNLPRACFYPTTPICSF